jgi:hypothetical protein
MFEPFPRPQQRDAPIGVPLAFNNIPDNTIQDTLFYIKNRELHVLPDARITIPTTTNHFELKKILLEKGYIEIFPTAPIDPR